MITIKYQCPDVSVFEIIKWCEDNCEGHFDFDRDWEEQKRVGQDRHIMKFELEKDATMFRLRWL